MTTPDKNIDGFKSTRNRLTQLTSDLITLETLTDFWYQSRQCHIVIDSGMLISQCSDRLLSTMGYDISDMVGHQLIDFLHTDDIEELSNDLSSINKDNVNIDRSLSRWIAKDGDIVVFMWTFSLHTKTNFIIGSASIIQPCVTNTKLVCYCQNNNKDDCYRDDELRSNRLSLIMNDVLKNRNKKI